MPATLTHEMSSASKHSYSPYKGWSRQEKRRNTALRPFLTVVNQDLLSNSWSEPLSPHHLPPAPKIRTVNLPHSSPTCGFFSDSPREWCHTPSKFSRPPTPSPKTRAGPFQVARSLNSGTYGSAVAAKDVSTKRRVCLKAIDKSRVRSKVREMHALRTELAAYKIIANCRPNSFVMDCHGVFQDETMVFFAMDHLKTDLHSMLCDDLDPNRIKRWTAQIAIGMSALHEMGIIHRDIKPENILVDNCDNIRISDFGTAFVCNEPVVRSRTYSTEYVGTKQYMAPEMLQKKSYNSGVDYWALGCMVYDLIVGDILFADTDKLREYLKWDSATEGMSYFNWKADLTAEAEDLISGLLRKNPRSRYSISDLRDHPYFLDEHGQNIFLEVENKSNQYSHASYLFEEDLQPIDISTVYHPTADPYVYDSPEFFHFGWINSRGLWGDN